MQGKTINGFVLKYKLGEGGMAEVWYAENKIGKKAAVKLLLPKFCQDEAIVERFQNEANVMVQLDHNNIRQVYDYGAIDNRPAIVMEYLEGDDLKALMNSGRRFNDEELRKWWNQIADALNDTHSKGIVHRDIKPSNIFLDKKGNIKLLDFGIAKIRESISSTQTGQKIGTLVYMSPEQVKDSKRIDYRTDIYSLAVTFVHLLTGRLPYDSNNCSDFEICEYIVYKPLDMVGVPVIWQQFLEPYLAKDPQQRPALVLYSGQQPTVVAKPMIENTVCYSNEETVIVDVQPTVVISSEPKPTSEKSRNGVNVGLKIGAAAVGGNAEYMNSERKKGVATDFSIRVGTQTICMMRVVGGTFTMGCSNGQDDDCCVDEKPTHSVTIGDYYIGKFEVTQGVWVEVMGNNPSYFKGDYNRPVENVSWDDCKMFIKKLNEKTGKNFRLPTEAEWEYAARGGNKSNGYKYSGSNNCNDVAWLYDNSDSKPHPVGTKHPNELGIYDMSGNVYEWCDDWYGGYTADGKTNPTGPSTGTGRVLRGGSWYHSARRCRVSNRYRNNPGDRGNFFGLRLVLS